MSTPRQFEDQLRETVRIHLETGNQTKTAERLNMSRSAVQDRLKQAARMGLIGSPPVPEIARPPEGFAVTENSGEYDEDGKLRRQWIKTKRDAGDEFAPLPGHVVKGESALLDPDGRVLARWVKTKDGSDQKAGLIEALRETFTEFKGVSPFIPDAPACDDDLLTEYPIADLHMGQLSWAPESGENYDIKIATETATKSLQALVDQSRPSKHAVLLFLGDFLHVADSKNATPASGHRLDADGRWHRIYSSAARLAVSMINIVAKKHQHVTVSVLVGNHDEDSAICLSVALALYFEGNSRVTIDNSPSVTFYRRFGRCLLGATHGHLQKPEAMAMAMAVDRADDWGNTTYRHIAYGHIHHATLKEIMGVHVESFQAITARDAYAASHGYRSGRSITAITWHKELGEIGRHRVNIAGAAARAAA